MVIATLQFEIYPAWTGGKESNLCFAIWKKTIIDPIAGQCWKSLGSSHIKLPCRVTNLLISWKML